MPSRRPSSLAAAPRARRIVRELALAYPDARCALNFRNPFELLVATILSAQCTDVRVNMVTPVLFARYPSPGELARADLAAVEAIIHPTGFFRAKAKNLVAMAANLVERHGGEVPAELDALIQLPGVGRKTANVVLGTAMGIASGVVVDTHVKRLAFRLGLTSSDDPVVIEQDLLALLPRKDWVMFSHLVITHGRTTCQARNPRCDGCQLEPICPRVGLEPR
jgi:endonuclease-3